MEGMAKNKQQAIWEVRGRYMRNQKLGRFIAVFVSVILTEASTETALATGKNRKQAALENATSNLQIAQNNQKVAATQQSVQRTFSEKARILKDGANPLVPLAQAQVRDILVLTSTGAKIGQDLTKLPRVSGQIDLSTQDKGDPYLSGIFDIKLSDGSEARAYRPKFTQRSELTEIANYLRAYELMESNPKTAGLLPKVIGIHTENGVPFLVLESFDSFTYLSATYTSSLAELETKHPGVAAKIKEFFAPGAMAVAKDRDSINVGFLSDDMLRIDANGKIRIDLARVGTFAPGLIDQIMQGKIFNLPPEYAAQPASFDGKFWAAESGVSPVDGASPAQLKVIIDPSIVNGPQRTRLEPIQTQQEYSFNGEDYTRRYVTDPLQHDLPMLSYSSHPSPHSSQSLKDVSPKEISSIQEALILTGRDYNKASGKSFDGESKSIGLETAVDAVVVKNGNGGYEVHYVTTFGEDTGVGSETIAPYLQKLRKSNPGIEIIMVKNYHTHDLYPTSLSSALLSSQDIRSGVGLHVLPKGSSEGANDGYIYAVGGYAHQVQSVAYGNNGHINDPQFPFKSKDMGSNAVAMEQTPALYNPSTFPEGSNPKEKVDEIKKAALMLEALEAQREVVQRVADRLSNELDRHMQGARNQPNPTIISVE